MNIIVLLPAIVKLIELVKEMIDGDDCNCPKTDAEIKKLVEAAKALKS